MVHQGATHGSLFSGIGGFDLAAQWMGWENAFHCEIDPWNRKILEYYWSKAKSYEDIRKTDFTVWRDRITVLSGGFPCQPFSTAGKRLGTEDDRDLWHEMCRAIREIQPRWIVGENVRGIVNWNEGMVFEKVQNEMEDEGYEVLTFLLPACGLEAPHIRERVFFIGYSKHNGLHAPEKRGANGQPQEQTGEDQERKLEGADSIRSAQFHFEDTLHYGCSHHNGESQSSIGRFRNPIPGTDERIRTNDDEVGAITDTELRGETRRISERVGWKYERYQENPWKQFPLEYPFCSGNDGLSERLDGVAFPKWRMNTIRGYGNAVVPQVAYQLFTTIQCLENTKKI